MAKVVVTKSKLDSLAQHINAKAGTTGAKTIAQMQATVDGISGGAAKETWVLNENCAIDALPLTGSFQISFTSNGTSYESLSSSDFKYIVFYLNYGETRVCTQDTSQSTWTWESQAYRKLTFDTPPTGALLTWLQANGVKQPDDTAVQDTKALTITSNGTVSVTPDAPYDALKKVDVTVDVASGGGGGAGFKVTFPATETNWDRVDPQSRLLLADGTTKPIHVYSDISGQTIENVIGIKCRSTSSLYVLKMTLSEGSVAQIVLASQYPSYYVTTSPNTTKTLYGTGFDCFWWPIADTVISAIEMYNTD